jgi:tRNA-2-methylthio-N6-dimethylallyladenosine synthase
MICRSSNDIVEEVERLVKSGTKYVTLLGQTVDAWREDGMKFCDLLERVSEAAPRVSFTTSHPSNMEDRTLKAIGERDTIVKRLHLPVQSGSDRMLKIMHRGYKSERYRRKIDVFREHAPEGALSTDIIVGHPGETEEDHQQTLSLVEHCEFDSAYIFKFSPRRGTEAALGEAVPDDVVKRRFTEVLGMVERNGFRRNQRKVGGTEEIYIRHGQAEQGQSIGETWTGHAVHLETEAAPGEYVKAGITSAGPHVLYAEAQGIERNA